MWFKSYILGFKICETMKVFLTWIFGVWSHTTIAFEAQYIICVSSVIDVFFFFLKNIKIIPANGISSAYITNLLLDEWIEAWFQSDEGVVMNMKLLTECRSLVISLYVACCVFH